MAFVVADGEVLTCRIPARAKVYPGRITTPSGPLADGETPEAAARRALLAETGLDAIPSAAGLPLEFTDTVRKLSVQFRIHPVLFRLAERPVVAGVEDLRWLTPADLVVASVQQETVPDLDEALARVLDPPAALPSIFRAEAHAIFADRRADSLELAGRAAALVMAGAPPERVAALRPARARFVHAARAAIDPERDVVGELTRAAFAAARFAHAALDSGRAAAFGPIAGVPVSAAADIRFDHIDQLLLGVEALTAAGDAIAPAGALALARAAHATRVRVTVVADAHAGWADTIPPPLEPGLELIPRALID